MLDFMSGKAKSISERLKMSREQQAMSLRDLSITAGVSNPLICQIEKGHVINPGVKTIYRLARALQCDPGWLAWGNVTRT